MNHIPYSSISEGIKTEYNKVIKETKKLNVADLPNLGFQFLMYDKDIKKDKLAKVICSILCAIEELQNNKYQSKSEIKRIEKLLQPRFSVFYI